MHIDNANIDNLTQLWKCYGALSLYEDEQFQLYKNISWPNRVWADMAKPVSEISLKQTAKVALDSTFFPLWPLMTKNGAVQQQTVDALVNQSRDWQPAFQHTAMALKLDKQQSVKTRSEVRNSLQFKLLNDGADISTWVTTGSKAFGYDIDPRVIASLLAFEDIQLVIAYDEKAQPVATGLLFKTGNVAGIHQIGVPADQQGRGYATQMMRYLIQSAEKWKVSYIVLQASEAGKPVYQKLGFVDQFLITYLKKNTYDIKQLRKRELN